MKATLLPIAHILIASACAQAADDNPSQSLTVNDPLTDPSAEKPCFSARQIAGLQKLLKKPYPKQGAWRYENIALASLSLNERVSDGNAAILKVKEEYFGRLVHDDTGAVHGSFHWYAYLLARIYFLFNRDSKFFPGRLSPEAEDAILDILWEWTHVVCRLNMVAPERDWWKWGSENHHIQMFGSLWACLDILARTEQYGQRSLRDGNSVRKVSQAFNDYFKRFAAHRATRSLFIEFNSPTYTKYSLSPLYSMVDFASAPELSRIMKAFLDVFWAQWAIEQIDGIRGGSRHRCYPGPASERSAGGGDGFAWYHFGLGEVASVHPGVITAATTFYQPHSIVTRLATQPDRRGDYEIVNRLMGRWAGRDDEETKAQYSSDPADPLYQVQGVYVAAPKRSGIRRYTYCTPEFILGSSMVPAFAADQWLAISSQNRWDWLTLGGSARARIFVQCDKPSRGSVYNTHWSVQHKGVLVVQRLKSHAKGARGNRIWIDGSLKVQESDGWVSAQSPAAYAAVRVTEGTWRWEPPQLSNKAAGRWMICDNEFAPVVIEAAGKSRFPSLDEFHREVELGVLKNKGPELRHTSRIYGITLTLYTDYSKSPEVDGRPIDFCPEMAVDSPFLQARYGGSTVELKGLDGNSVQYDFKCHGEKQQD